MNLSMSGGAAPLPTAYAKRFFGLSVDLGEDLRSSPPYCFSSAEST
jgi:hypothetical protein